MNILHQNSDNIDYRFENYLLEGEYSDQDIRIFTFNSLYLLFKELEDIGDIRITDNKYFLDNNDIHCECNLTQIQCKIISNDMTETEQLIESAIKREFEYLYNKPYIWIDETQIDKCFRINIIDNYEHNQKIFRIMFYMSNVNRNKNINRLKQ